MIARARRVLVALAIIGCLAGGPRLAADGQKTIHVKGYTKKDGKKVAPHDRKVREKRTAPPKTAKPKKKSTVRQTAVSLARDERGRIQRSDAARHAFAQQTGFPKGRPGYVIDHIVSLACGGADKPSNMQWQTVAEAKSKDKTERIGCR